MNELQGKSNLPIFLTVIPARMGSSRFPGKPMADLLGMPMIGHVYQRALKTQLDGVRHIVYVATCDHEIFDYIRSVGGNAVMTKNTHERCTDRTFEAFEKIQKDFEQKFLGVAMVQGDEPMVTPQMIKAVIAPFLNNSKRHDVVNLYSPIYNEEEFLSPHTVKVVMNKWQEALYFSREPIPSRKKFSGDIPRYKQDGIIAFSSDYLKIYSSTEETQLEVIESVDMNRVLENGVKIQMALSLETSKAVDTPDDLKLVEKYLLEEKSRGGLIGEYL